MAITDIDKKRTYTKNQIKVAGNNLANGTNIDDSMEALSYWRAKHQLPLERAFDTVRGYVGKVSTSKEKSFSPLMAKRLKRTESIVNKLQRFKDMQLVGMNDIGGCRVVLSSQKKVYKLSRALIKDGHFKLRRDYIENPKESGYRSIHLIGRFLDEDGVPKPVELQIRTRIQHSWATALEIVDLYTRQSIKTNAGGKEWSDFFTHISAIFAVLEENPYVRSSNPMAIAREFARNVLEKNDPVLEYSLFRVHYLSERLRIVNIFDAFSSSVKVTSEHIREASIDGYILISIQRTGTMFEIQSSIYRRLDFKKASSDYLELEKKAIGKDSDLIVALVSTNALGGIQEAYPNYFADARAFLEFLMIASGVYEKIYSPPTRLIHKVKSIFGSSRSF